MRCLTPIRAHRRLVGSRDAPEPRLGALPRPGASSLLAASVELGAEALAFWRLALAAVTLASIALLLARRPPGAPGQASCAGSDRRRAGRALALFFEAVEHGSVALAVLTFYAAPLVIALLAPLVLPERLSVVLGACSSARPASPRSRSTRVGR